MYFVYILECENRSLYTGSTDNVERRFKDHCLGKGARYTRMHKPIRVAYVEECATKSEALSREATIKHLSHKEKKSLTNNKSTTFTHEPLGR
ncbi:MAG: GIY-YIG nuclease family protein [Patescibacteria group bacterium]